MKRKAAYDIVVAGGGHAGVEAAAAAARLGADTLLVTMRVDEIARLSCNPAIGGLGKGHLVREIDALGGIMGQAADANGIQFRMLNTTKGPAVRAPRAQEDKVDYPAWVRKRLLAYSPRLTVCEGVAGRVRLESGRVCGVDVAPDESGAPWETVRCRALVVTAGTFLDGLIHLGMETHPGGRWGNPPSTALARSLEELGLETRRLKTGTPARIHRDSIDWDRLEQQGGEVPPPCFSYLTRALPQAQTTCAVTRTTPRTHAIILAALDRSPLYTGRITGIGPRYCPSIETKLLRFPDKDSHQIFLEPESRHNGLVYVNGVSTSLPPEVQDRFLPTIEGLEKVRVARHGYGIEYLAFPPEQMLPTLETRDIPGLYLAGQVNGTTGYEEAAGLGLAAGANAALALRGRPPFRPRRDQAYLGVMIDDLVTKGAPEPYRLFTSRAEYRLLLRQDNADLRLTPLGREAGLVDDERWEAFQSFREETQAESERLAATRLRPGDLDPQLFAECGEALPLEPATLERLLARPGIHLRDLARLGAASPRLDALLADPATEALARRVLEQVEVQVKYAGYIERQNRQIARALEVETTPLPEGIDYAAVPSLRSEAVQVLSARRPPTLGQASRHPGVNPADVTALLIHLAVGNVRADGPGSRTP